MTGRNMEGLAAPSSSASSISTTTIVAAVTPEQNEAGASVSGENSNNTSEKRPSTSLPLFHQRIDLSDIGPRTGMECMPLRSPPGPYHYHHVSDQTKSLQELQNEVGALLEFRDLVIETFPDLKNKMASSSSASSTLTGMQSTSLASRREWEPGIRVRRKLMQKENSEISSSSLIRSRSNSHSGKKEPKSGEGNGSVVQDSGFSTETSSSKETHSASSTSGTATTQTVLMHASSTHHHHRNSGVPIDAAENELWNLLDVIHRKSNRLREEVEYLQSIEKEQSRTNSIPPSFMNQLERLSKDDVQILRKERDQLLDKIAEMEAETITNRIRTEEAVHKLDNMTFAKRKIEEELKIALSQKVELNTRIHDMHQQFVQTATTTKSDSVTSTSSPPKIQSVGGTPLPSARTSLSSAFATTATSASSTSSTPLVTSSSSSAAAPPNQRSSFQPVILKNSTNTTTPLSSHATIIDSSYVNDSKLNLGRLDGVVSSPNRPFKVRVADSKKIAAILLETNPIELQRHLLTVTFQNQVLQQRLETATKSKIAYLNKVPRAAKEEIEDLKFQLEEKSIELEGTKAQLRVLELKMSFSPEHHLPRSHFGVGEITRDSTITRLQTSVSTPSMKAMVPLAMDEVLQNSSSTESAQDQAERDKVCPETPKRRPSKIPLPGTKTPNSAPKPPTGRNNYGMTRSTSGPPSNRSLNKSTSSLLGKSESSLVKKESPSLIRPESAQSWRKDSSLNNRSSSIPVSAKTSPVKPSFSPVPKAKRDSLTSKVRNLDSLSRIQSSSAAMPSSPALSSNLYKSSSKKDLSATSFSSNSRSNLSDRKVGSGVNSVRRVSSVSVGGGRSGIASSTSTGDHHQQQQGEENGKDNQNLAEQSRDLIREYFTKGRSNPPPIFQAASQFTAIPSDANDDLNLAYRHPILLLDHEGYNDDENDDDEICYYPNELERNDDILMATAEEASFIVPVSKKNAFSSLTAAVTDDVATATTSPCRLIGRVNPNLIKTWEQLKTTNGGGGGDKITSLAMSDTSDKQECVLFYRKPFNFKEENGFETKFHVNRVVHSESSGDFYDSIDDPSIIENTYVVGEDIMASMYNGSEMVVGGEGMAECDSMDKKKICWSIENI